MNNSWGVAQLKTDANTSDNPIGLGSTKTTSNLQGGGTLTYTLAMTALLALSLSPILAAGQECEDLKSRTASAGIGYLRHAGDDTTAQPCVDRAFRQIASAPQEQAISLLIDLLGYKRPLSEGERLGIFMHGDGLTFIPCSSRALCPRQASRTGIAAFHSGNQRCRKN
jgi:hypothetical protein